MSLTYWYNQLISGLKTADYFLKPTAKKTGDINADGKVDIFDYFLLVFKFGNPYTAFDYNIVVTNFGK